MNTQKRLNMNIGYYTKTLCDELRKGLLITLTLLFVCPSVWGQTWVEISDATDLRTQFNKTSGTTYIRLTQDFNENGLVVNAGNTIVLDLNGHTIAKTNYHGDYSDYSSTGFIIKIEAGATLTIQDNSETHLGAIRNGRMAGPGGGVWNLGRFYLQSGNITGNNCDHGSGNDGGGVYNGGTMVMSGGTISNNAVYNSGGGIFNATGATLTITGGTITGNSCYYNAGGGIYNLGTLNISGNPTINANIRTYGNTNSANNVYLPSEKTITIGTGGLTGNANSIGITMQTPGTFTTGATSENDYTKFFSDDNHYEAVAVSIDGDAGDNNVKLKSCWSLLDRQIAEETSGNITLTKDYEAVTTDTYLSVPNSQNITIDLNGHTLNRNTSSSAKADGCVIRNLGTLTITDNSTGHTGAIYGGNNTNGAGGIHNEGTLNFNGGTIRNNISGYSGGGIYNAGTLEISGENTIIQNNSTTKLGAGIYNGTGGTIILNTGTIQSNTNTGEHGGGIYNNGTLTVNGGSISNNTLNTASKHGGGIYNAGTLSINGGTIQNNTVKNNTGLGAGIYHDGTAFNLQGAPDISSNKIVNTSTQCNVYLTTDKKITITGTLSNETAISLNMQTLGEFTTGFAAHSCSLDKFSSEAGATVKLTNYNADYSLKEAELITYWSYLNRQFSDNNISSITLEAGTYQATSTEPYLHMPSGRIVSLNLSSKTLNRQVGNTAKTDGCVLYNEGTLTITGNGTIQGGNNSGTGKAQGGGIYNTGTLHFNGGTISGNTSSLRGGGIYNAGTLTIAGGYVQANTATGVGRGVYNASGKTMTLESGAIQNNTGGTDHGGGVYNDGTLNMTGGTISGNKINTTDKNGGGVYNNGTMTVSGGDILNNTAKGNGGGIYNASSLTISGGNISSNGNDGASSPIVAVKGGGIYNAGTLTVSGGTIQTNTASSNGAGIYHEGPAFELSGGPTIKDNKIGNQQNNIYLPEAQHIITITANLTNTNEIGITMETPNVFTSGLTGKGTYTQFKSDYNTKHKLINSAGEAALATHWNYLQSLIINAAENAVIELETSCIYKADDNDTYLHVPSGKTFTLDLKGNTINRNLTTTAKDDGCVIFNEGTLTIKNTTGTGYILYGNNSDGGEVHGGGICNAGTLTIQSGNISNNTSYSSGGGIYNTGTLNIQGGTITQNTASNTSGGGIYHNGTAFSLQGNMTISGNTANGATNNVYLESGKKITIAAKLTNTTAIGITSADNHPVFTTGLKGYDDDDTRLGNASNFKADLDTHGIGLDSNGDAIVGLKYNVNRVRSTYWETYSYVYIKGEYYKAMTAVEGETVKVKIRGESTYGTIPVSFDCDGVPFHPYPEADVEYSFVMPAHDVTVTGECQRGGYCGEADEKDIKYYLKNGTLYFMTKDANSYEMQNYAYGSVPWSNLSYTAIDIPTTVTTISPYAFYGKDITTANIHQYIISIGMKAFMGCTHLTNISVDGSNANYSSSDGVLYNKAKADLICYPAGKEDHSYTLPSTVQSIAEGAFAYGSHLQTITVATGNPHFMATSDGVLFEKYLLNPKAILVYYPAGKTDAIYEVPTTATTIAPYAFHSASASLDYVFLLHSSLPTGGTSMFDLSDFNIMVNNNILNSYKGTEPWSDYGTTSNNRYLPIELIGATITLDNSYSLDYTGSALAPPVTSVVKYRTLTQGTDYTVSYSNNVNVGTATVTITGQGVYNGQEVTKNFNITRYVNFGATNSNYVTYYASENLKLPDRIPKGTSSYDGYSYYNAYAIESISWDTKTITLVNFSDGNNIGYIPANTAVLLYNDFSAPFNCVNYPTRFHLTLYEGTEKTISASTEFRGHDEDKLYNDINPRSKPLYVLRNNKFTRVEGTTGTLPARHCYIIDSSEVSSAPAYLSISGIDDNTTGITMEDGRGKTEELFSADWYTINGVKLNGMPTKKGIYINNGRKVIIK